MGSTRRIIESVVTFGGSEVKRKTDRRKRQREVEAAAAAELERSRLEEIAEEVPTLEDEEVVEAGRLAVRKIQRLSGRRATIKTTRRIALGKETIALGDRPIGRPKLGGF